MQRLTMVNIVLLGFGTYEQFISVLWNNSFLLTMFYGTAPCYSKSPLIGCLSQRCLHKFASLSLETKIIT